jgi:hypothetical protein
VLSELDDGAGWWRYLDGIEHSSRIAHRESFLDACRCNQSGPRDAKSWGR